MRRTLTLAGCALAIAALSACGGGGGGSDLAASAFGDSGPPPAPPGGPRGAVPDDIATIPPAPPPQLPTLEDITNTPRPTKQDEAPAPWFPGEPNVTPPALPNEVHLEQPGHQSLGGGGPPQPVPEPEEVVLFLMGATLLLVTLWRRGVFENDVPDAA